MDVHSESITTLHDLTCQYAFYLRQADQQPVFQHNCTRFHSASLIKVPILLAWLILERTGEVDPDEICDLDAEPPVTGSGFSFKLAQRRLPYHDVLMMMIATSDNLCTNLVIRRAGLERLNGVIHAELGLSQETSLERKLMDYAARKRGLDNWVGAADCIQLFGLVRSLPPAERSRVDAMLLACTDSSLLARDLPRELLDEDFFYHKTGNVPGVLHDWGYTPECDVFLLTQDVADEAQTNAVFGRLGRLLV